MTRNIVILGLGVTGISVLRQLIKASGVRTSKKDVLTGFDEGFDRFSPDLQKSLRRKLDRVITDRRLLNEPLKRATQIVVSPGIDIRRLGISLTDKRITSDLDMAYKQSPSSTFLAVTGTNGKTTTALLLASILKAQFGSNRVVVAGNIGTPLLDSIQPGKKKIYVLELSSFQLELSKLFRPNVGIFLNLSQDHLDRHKTMSAYFFAKSKLFQNSKPADVGIINADDLYGRKLLSKSRSGRLKKVGFSIKKNPGGTSFYISNGNIVKHAAGKDEILLTIPAGAVGPGAHNMSNMVSAVAAGNTVGAKPKAILKALRSFKLPAHRLELVRRVNDVSYYDDSKATSVDAVMKAIDSFPSRQVIALMGGRDKGMNFVPLFRKLSRQRNMKALVLFGELAPKLHKLSERFLIPRRDARGMADAVRQANVLVAPGDVVLLTPGGTSFDQYKNYSERGNDFRACVRKLRSKTRTRNAA